MNNWFILKCFDGFERSNYVSFHLTNRLLVGVFCKQLNDKTKQYLQTNPQFIAYCAKTELSELSEYFFQFSSSTDFKELCSISIWQI